MIRVWYSDFTSFHVHYGFICCETLWHFESNGLSKVCAVSQSTPFTILFISHHITSMCVNPSIKIPISGSKNAVAFFFLPYNFIKRWRRDKEKCVKRQFYIFDVTFMFPTVLMSASNKTVTLNNKLLSMCAWPSLKYPIFTWT